MLSIVIPAFNEGKIIAKTAEVISGILENEKIPYELLFVNDGSRDNTWDQIVQCSRKNAQIRGICFSRNFGKESAMFAGLGKAKGDCCVIIDCDLQHPPEKIVDMYRLWQEGYEVVEGIKTSRGTESKAHAFAAKCFYDIIGKAVRRDMTEVSDFKLLDRKVVNALLEIPERNAFFRALSSWVGFKTAKVEYEVRDREVGESKWSTKALIRYAITNITSFSAAPLQIVTVIGAVLFAVSVIGGILALVRAACGIAVGTMTPVMLLIAFVGSILMIAVGIIGYYIEKIYEEVKARPRYIISSTVGMNRYDK